VPPSLPFEIEDATLAMCKGRMRISVQLFVHHPPPEIPKPSEISEAFQEVVTTQFLEVVPEAGLEPARF
jgi:hypothetical protein